MNLETSPGSTPEKPSDSHEIAEKSAVLEEALVPDQLKIKLRVLRDLVEDHGAKSHGLEIKCPSGRVAVLFSGEICEMLVRPANPQNKSSHFIASMDGKLIKGPAKGAAALSQLIDVIFKLEDSFNKTEAAKPKEERQVDFFPRAKSKPSSPRNGQSAQTKGPADQAPPQAA
jgi:hypothetical protein